jgi:hypothetical protein
MAAKKSGSKTTTSKISSAKNLWGAVSSTSWHRTLSARNPGGNWTLQGSRIKGCCPYHKETTASFYIDLSKGFAKCFGGSCGEYRDDPLTFLADVAGVTVHEVLSDIVQGEWSITLPKSLSADIQARRERVELRQAIQDVCHATLLTAVQNIGDPAFQWAQPTIQWLAQRGLDLTKLDRLPIGILPTRRVLYMGMQTEVLRKTYSGYMGDVLVPPGLTDIGPYTGALTFHYMASPGTAGCTKVRRPNDPTGGVLWVGGEGQDEHGLFCLDLLTALLGTPSVIYVVEGEFDALSLLRAQIAKHGTLKYGVIGGSGAGVSSLDALRELGCSDIRLLGDYDNGGVGFTRLALEQTRADGVHVYDWANGSLQDYPKIDPDEVVMQGMFDKLEADFARPECWLPRHAWVSQQISEAAVTNKSSLADLQKAMVSFGSCLHELIDKDAVIQDLRQDDNIPKTVLQATLLSSSTDETYVAMLVRHLEVEMTPLAHEGMAAVIYARRDSTVVTLPLNRAQDMLTVLGTKILHALPYEWCRARLGDPDWLMYGTSEGDERQALPYAIRTARNNELLVQAVTQLCADLPDKARLTVKRQGVHYHESDDRQTRALYVVNGAQVYKGRVHGPEPLVFEPLTSPRDVGWLFMAGRGAQWSSVITDLDALNNACEQDPQQVYETIRSMLQDNWTFSLSEDVQKMEAAYLAGVALYTVIAQGFPYVSQILINAPTNSGKSKLMMGLFSGSQFEKIKLVEHAVGMDAYTVAGVFQSMDGAGQMLCLDEFEVSNARDPKRQKIVSELLSTMRMNYASGTKKVQGTASQEASFQGFRVPVMAAAIAGFDRIEDANRWNTITLHNVEAASGPDENIVRQYSPERIRELRTACTLLPLQQYGKIYEHYQELHDKYGTLQGLPKGTGDRMLQPMLPIAAVMRWCGQDVDAFLPRYIQHKITSSKSEIRTEYQQILHDVLNTPAIVMQGDIDRIKMSVASVLQSPGGAAGINTTQCGVYVDDYAKYVVVVVAQVYHTTLRGLNRYRDQNTTYLRKQLQQHPHALKEREVVSEKIMTSLQRYVSLDTTIHDIVVYPLSKLVTTRSEVVYQAADADVRIAQSMMPSLPKIDEDDMTDI